MDIEIGIKLIINVDRILNSISESAVTIDKNFTITYFNRSAEKLIGFSRKEVTGKKCSDVCKSPFCEIECPIAIVLKTGRPIYDFDSVMPSKQHGKIKVCLNAAILFDDQDQPKGGVISFRKKVNRINPDEMISDDQNFHKIIGRSKQMIEIYELIKEISANDAAVLIQGETGVGKEMIANAIQATGDRNGKAFIKVHCSILPDQLLASELFRHSKVAFTDAKTERIGRLEVTQNGKILELFNCIGQAQHKLHSDLSLRFLEFHSL